MDPVTHTLTGAALSRSGLHRATPLATATLVLAANAPDVDILAYVSGPYSALAFRRGWTHGVLAVVVLPFVVLAFVLACDAVRDRLRRRGDRPAGGPTGGADDTGATPGGARPRARPRAVLALALVGVLSHPMLDWLNTYGVRPLMPFDGRWFYGDALFIIDPWIWLLLGGALVIADARTPASRAGWAALALLLTLAILGTAAVPVPAKAIWLLGLLAVMALRVRGLRRMRDGARRRGAPDGERAVRLAAAAALLYVAAMIAASGRAESLARALATDAGRPPVDVMFQPSPANPFAGTIVLAMPDPSGSRGSGAIAEYRFGTLDWFARPRARIEGPALEVTATSAAAAIARADAEVRRFLAWSRFPYFAADTAAGRVRVGDARYPVDPGVGSLGGLSVPLQPGPSGR